MTTKTEVRSQFAVQYGVVPELEEAIEKFADSYIADGHDIDTVMNAVEWEFFHEWDSTVGDFVLALRKLK